jgi:hypothetical protein
VLHKFNKGSRAKLGVTTAILWHSPGQRRPGGTRCGADGHAICSGTRALASYMFDFRHMPACHRETVHGITQTKNERKEDRLGF